MRKNQVKASEKLKLIDEQVDADLVVATAETLTAAMARARDKGKTQWWNPMLCTEETLRNFALDAARRQDFQAMLAFSAMVLYRQTAE